MKKLFFALSLSIGLGANAQTKTLIGSGSGDGLDSYGFVLSGGMQNSQLYGESVWFSQFKAGVILNESWTIGASYGESVEYIRPTSLESLYGKAVEVDFMQYSGFLEYRIKPSSLVHLSFPLHLGVFETDVDDYDPFDNDSDNDWMDLEREDYQFFVEPGVTVELNLHKYARVYAGASYRLPLASTYSEGITPDPENHLLINFGVKVGIFNLKELIQK